MRATAQVRRLPWILWGLAMVLVALGDGLLALHATHSPARLFDSWPRVTLNAVAFATVGAVVAARRRDNPIGWLFLVVGVGSAVQMVTGEYAMYDRYVLRDGLPGTAVSAWVSAVVAFASFDVVSFVALVFPAGQFVSPRWRRFGWVAVVLMVLSGVAIALSPGEFHDTAGIDNPFGLDPQGGLIRSFGAFAALPVFFFLLLLVAGIASLLIRWRRSGTEQQAQLKWVVFAAAFGFGGIVLATLLYALVGGWVLTIAWTVGLAVVPVAAGISILRYRLYDIDRIVSRTVSYAVVTGLLIAAYVGLVTAVTRLTPTGNSLAVAGSTLAVAALFQPLRRRVQAAVDRRFNRSRYDAARTVEVFSARLREQVDLESLTGDLIGVVRGTLQPSSLGVWLRSPGGVAR